MSSTANVDFSLFGGAEILPPSHENASTSSDDETSSNSSSTEPSKKYERAGEEWAPRKVTQNPNDWLWQMTEEPHRSRRKAILKAHPEVSSRDIGWSIGEDHRMDRMIDLVELEWSGIVQENGDGQKYLLLESVSRRPEGPAPSQVDTRTRADAICVVRSRN